MSTPTIKNKKKTVLAFLLSHNLRWNKTINYCFFQDFVHGLFHLDLSERASFFLTQSLAVVYGFLSFLVIYVVKFVPGVLQVREIRTMEC